MYHYIILEVVMRDCKDEVDARLKCERLLPYNPDENSTYMESWNIVEVTPAVSPSPPRV